MSLLNPPSKLNVGIIASKNFDDPDFLEDLFFGKIDKIGHINTNGANYLILDFARENGIIYTVYPINCRSLPWSNSRIIESSDFVFIISNENSKSARLAEEECKKEKSKNKRNFNYKIVSFNPVENWKAKVEKIKQITDSFTDEQLNQNNSLNLIKVIIDKPKLKKKEEQNGNV